MLFSKNKKYVSPVILRLKRILYCTGGEEEIRTLDPHVANVMLYQLSYFPLFVKSKYIIYRI